jgi:hypothetical protein
VRKRLVGLKQRFAATFLMLFPRDNVRFVPCKNVRFDKSGIRFFFAKYSKENLHGKGHYKDEF